MLLTGESNYQKAAEVLMQGGVKIVVVTLGKTGAYVQTRQGGQLVKGFRNKAADATGAGDAFWGGFLFQFSRCGKAPEAVTTEEAESLQISEMLWQAFVSGSMGRFRQCRIWLRS